MSITGWLFFVYYASVSFNWAAYVNVKVAVRSLRNLGHFDGIACGHIRLIMINRTRRDQIEMYIRLFEGPICGHWQCNWKYVRAYVNIV